MTKIQKVVREIENLQDFYKRTKLLRMRIKEKHVKQLNVDESVWPSPNPITVSDCSKLKLQNNRNEI
ncbi:MAG: hypothetical protein HQK77_00390 [Desulfobacterales bacterium]|nr:hypothetical protein [Desulfobacterales bacterium]